MDELERGRAHTTHLVPRAHGKTWKVRPVQALLPGIKIQPTHWQLSARAGPAGLLRHAYTHVSEEYGLDLFGTSTGRTGWQDWTSTPSATTHCRLRPHAPRRTSGRGGPRAVDGPWELRVDACPRATGYLALSGRGAVSGLKAELDIGADRQTSA
jgi:hypothetical protein